MRGGGINDEQRTLKLLSIKIQPNKTEVIHRCDRCDKVVSTRRTLMVCILCVHEFSFCNSIQSFSIHAQNRSTFESCMPHKNHTPATIVREVSRKRTDWNGIFAFIQVKRTICGRYLDVRMELNCRSIFSFQVKNHLRAKDVHGVSINREICEFMRNRVKNSYRLAIERNGTKLIKEKKSCRMSCCVIFIHFIDSRNRIFHWIDTVS